MASTAMAMAAVPKVARVAKVAKAVAMMATAKWCHSPLQVLHQIVGCRLPELATGTERHDNRDVVLGQVLDGCEIAQMCVKAVWFLAFGHV